MTKLEALKACVWLEHFITADDWQDFEHMDAIEKVRGIQRLIARLPDDSAEDPVYSPIL